MPEHDDAVAVRCRRLVKHYSAPTGETQALRGVEATFSRGAVAAVTGPSGSGKSSLLAIIALRERQTGGDLEVLGRSVSTLPTRELVDVRRREISWVAQRPTDSLFPHLTAAEQLRAVASLRGRSSADASRALDLVELGHRAGSLPGTLSGGEQQRLAVAAAVLSGTTVLVADEPTAELDDESAQVVLRALRARADDGACVIVSTHDDRAMRSSDRTLALRHGVLSTETGQDGPSLAPIDSAGRVQLPPSALELFPAGRARLVVEADAVRLLPPEDVT